jgi:hypothetical protein
MHQVEFKNREIEQARAALEEKAEQLSLSSRYKSEFLANMSHGIVGMAADGTMSGPHYEPGISPGKEDGEK